MWGLGQKVCLGAVGREAESVLVGSLLLYAKIRRVVKESRCAVAQTYRWLLGPQESLKNQQKQPTYFGLQGMLRLRRQRCL
jgi:hypothetical protein